MSKDSIAPFKPNGPNHNMEARLLDIWLGLGQELHYHPIIQAKKA